MLERDNRVMKDGYVCSILHTRMKLLKMPSEPFKQDGERGVLSNLDALQLFGFYSYAGTILQLQRMKSTFVLAMLRLKCPSYLPMEWPALELHILL